MKNKKTFNINSKKDKNSGEYKNFSINSHDVKPFKTTVIDNKYLPKSKKQIFWNCLLLEDCVQTAQFLQQRLKAHNIFCDLVYTSNTFLQKLSDPYTHYSLILMDHNLRDSCVSGVNLINLIQKNKRMADVPLLFITNYNNIENRIEVLRAGAVDMMNKPISNLEFKELILRIHRVLTGSTNIMHSNKKNIIKFGELCHNVKDRSFSIGDTPLELSVCESTILCALFNKRGSVCSRNYILRALEVTGNNKKNNKSSNSKTSTKAVDVFLCRIRNKIKNLFKKVYGDREPGFKILTRWSLGYTLVNTMRRKETPIQTVIPNNTNTFAAKSSRISYNSGLSFQNYSKTIDKEGLNKISDQQSVQFFNI